MICEYCKKEFSNKSTLNHHQKSAKYCLKMQGRDNEIIKEKKEQCFICMKSFSSKSYLITHLESLKCGSIYDLNTVIKDLKLKIEEFQDCKESIKHLDYKNKELKDENIQLMDELKKLLHKNKNLESNIIEMNNDIHILRGMNTILENDHDCIKDIAKQPKTVNNNKVLNITPLDFSDLKHVKNIIDDKYKINYIFSGQKGMAKFTFDHLLKDENGKKQI